MKTFLSLMAMSILLAFTSQASSVTVANECSKSVIQEVYSVNGYQKKYNGWEKIPIKIKVTSTFGGEKIEVVAYQVYGNWSSAGFSYVTQVPSYDEGYANFDYKVSVGGGTIYFNF